MPHFRTSSWLAIAATLGVAAGCVEPLDPDADVAAHLATPDLEPHALDPDPFGVAVAGADLDGDGYDATSDCAALDATIHPYRKELANGIDDNCEQGADEPMLAYARTRPPETRTYPQIPNLTLRIADAATIAYLNAGGTVKYHFTFQRLSDGSSADYVTPHESVAIASPGNWVSMINLATGETTRFLTIDPNHPARGLLARTVYRWKIQLHTSLGADLGPDSGWFYVVTGGTSTSPNTTLQWGRVDVALIALDQYGDSEDGLVGKGGTTAPDGERFTASNLLPLHEHYHANDDLLWCDWFVHYVGAVVTDGLDGLAANPVVDGGSRFWHEMNPNNVPNSFRDPLGDGCGTEIGDADGDGIAGELLGGACQSLAAGTVTLDTDDNEFFSNQPNNVYHDPIKSLPGNQGLGNYQAMDSHAGTFLAFDPDGDGSFAGAGGPGTVWSIEGNVGNHVRVMHRAADDPVINGFGKLTLAMFQ